MGSDDLLSQPERICAQLLPLIRASKFEHLVAANDLQCHCVHDDP